MTLGFRRAGFDVLAGVDANPRVVAQHKLNFPTIRTQELSITHRTTAAQLREATDIGNSQIDVVFGGPPCQGFSYAGAHKRSDPRNRLIIEAVRLAADLGASYFVLENVRGLLAPRHARTLKKLVSVAAEHGFAVVAPIRSLDAQHYGVPQRRERVFILGHRVGSPAPVYPARRAGQPPKTWEAIGDLNPVDDNRKHWDGLIYSGPLGQASEYARALRDSEGGLSGFGPTAHTSDVRRRFRDTSPGSREPVSRFHRLNKAEVSYTIRAGTGPDNGSFMAPRPIHPTRARCIYPREAARLHSFPDSFQFDATLWHAFRQIGNSVPPLLAEAIALSTRTALEAYRAQLSAKRSA
jgi:DNA (cytosine-5)-methyltransferase 1